MPNPLLYDRIGGAYSVARRDDPRIAKALASALGDARTLVNIGAGTGSYEPRDRDVIAVEPARTVIAQRARDAAPCVRALAEALPFASASFDTALAVLTLHHWHDWRRGIAEMRRVSRGRVVIFTWDPDRVGAFWMNTHYLPEAGVLDVARFPRIPDLLEALGGGRSVPVPIPHDCVDGFYGAYWRRPEAYLRVEVHRGISVLQQLPRRVVSRAMAQLAGDLASGAWEKTFGELRSLDALDLGYRLVVRE